MLDLTALITKDSLEPLRLPGHAASGIEDAYPFGFASPAVPCRLAHVRAMIHCYALRCAAPALSGDRSAVLISA
jgi:hypothetical protein